MAQGTMYIETNKTNIGEGYVFGFVTDDKKITIHDVQDFIDDKKNGETVVTAEVSIDGVSQKILKCCYCINDDIAGRNPECTYCHKYSNFNYNPNSRL